MSVVLAENLFSSTMEFDMDSMSVEAAKEKFTEYQQAGIIKSNCTFEDSVWQTTDQYSNVGLYFDFNSFAYKKYEPIFNLTLEQFTDYTKAFCISLFGKNVLSSMENTLLDIKHILEKDHEEICGEMSDLRLYSPNRMSDFLSIFVTDTNTEIINRLVGAMDAYSDFQYGAKALNQRELADFETYFEFDDILKDYWQSGIPSDERFFYYPLYLWWILTAVIPLRPREFLLTPRDCLLKAKDGRYNLKLRRNQLKGGVNGMLAYTIEDAYQTQVIPIPDYLGKTIEKYIKETEKYDCTDINTLFVTDPHYKKWGQKKHSDSRFLTYTNLRTILQYFFEDIVHGKYGYTVLYNGEEVNHDKKEIAFIHLGDARHLAFINMMQEGATPVTAMLLGGHANIEMAGHYYSNVSTFIECQTYRQYRKQISGDKEYKLSRTDTKMPSVAKYRILSDGSTCFSPEFYNGSIEDCKKVIGPNSEIGYCPRCRFCRLPGRSYYDECDIYKQNIKQDCEALFRAVQAIREGKGNEEGIKEAILRLNTSKLTYREFLEEKYAYEHDGEEK